MHILRYCPLSSGSQKPLVKPSTSEFDPRKKGWMNNKIEPPKKKKKGENVFDAILIVSLLLDFQQTNKKSLNPRKLRNYHYYYYKPVRPSKKEVVKLSFIKPSTCSFHWSLIYIWVKKEREKKNATFLHSQVLIRLYKWPSCTNGAYACLTKWKKK